MTLTETITWIPVEERVPEDDRRVMTLHVLEPGWITSGEERIILAYNYWLRVGRWARELHAKHVTHWGEMPKGPT